jgi:hypothetical protein
LRRSEKSPAKLLEILIADFSLRAKSIYFKITAAPFEMTLAAFSVFPCSLWQKMISRKGAMTQRRSSAFLGGKKKFKSFECCE